MSMTTTRKSYPSDVSDAECEFLLPDLTLMRCDAPQRSHDLRDVVNAVRYLVKTGCHWRILSHDGKVNIGPANPNSGIFLA
jgi:transposase